MSNVELTHAKDCQPGSPSGYMPFGIEGPGAEIYWQACFRTRKEATGVAMLINLRRGFAEKVANDPLMRTIFN